ncbi:hypothetical protein ACP70R_039514 [Stipagrostis hirtigluma subsp. patula]
MAGTQDLCHLLMLLGASVVVFAVAGEPSVDAGHALAGFLLWLLGVARLLLFGQIGQRPLFPGRLEATTANLARRGAPLLLLIGASVVVVSVAGGPPASAPTPGTRWPASCSGYWGWRSCRRSVGPGSGRCSRDRVRLRRQLPVSRAAPRPAVCSCWSACRWWWSSSSPSRLSPSRSRSPAS